jgi:hypothetical protein
MMIDFFRGEDQELDYDGSEMQLSSSSAGHHTKEKLTRKFYKFMSILIKEAISRFPKNIDLKIINAFVFKNKLKNEFKAVFELMNCEVCSPTLHDQFIIFRRKIEVE